VKNEIYDFLHKEFAIEKKERKTDEQFILQDPQERFRSAEGTVLDASRGVPQGDRQEA
jgi:hypothetical protein